MELTPGPNMGYLAMVAAYHGRKAGFAAVFGVALGLAGLGLFAALGLTALVAAYPPLYHALRWAGVVYLLWIAWESWRGMDGIEKHAPAISLKMHFKRGLITNLLNPKAFLFYVTVVPRFVPEDADKFSWMLGLALVEVVIATLIHSGIVALASTAHSYLRNEMWATLTRRIMALVLVGIAIWLGWSTR